MVNNNVISRQQALLAAQGLEHPELELGENIAELAYGLHATPWMQINLNVQYIGNPGAFSFKHLPDAWVFGAHMGLVFWQPSIRPVRAPGMGRHGRAKRNSLI